MAPRPSRLKAAARQRLAGGQGELDLGLDVAALAATGSGPLQIASSRMGRLWDGLGAAYDALGFAEAVAAACAAHAALGPSSLVLFDVSTLYFETDAGDGFREPGFSKERRLEPQITVREQRSERTLEALLILSRI